MAIKMTDVIKNRRRSDKPIYKRIRFKVIVSISVVGFLLLFFAIWLIYDSMKYVEKDILERDMVSDFMVFQDCISYNQKAIWEIKDKELYCNGILCGDGINEIPSNKPFEIAKKYTQDECYIYIKRDDGNYVLASGTVGETDKEYKIGQVLPSDIVAKLNDSDEHSYFINDEKNKANTCDHYTLIYDANSNPIAIFVSEKNVETVNSIMKKQLLRGIILIFAMMSIMSFGLSYVVDLLIKDIDVIRDRLKDIGEGNLDLQPLMITSGDEIADVAQSVNEMVESLKEKERIGTELSLAKEIQAHMLPSIFPPFPDHHEFNIFAMMEPAKEVGGDFYDFFMLDDKNLAMVIADVSGKGIPAAMFMVITKTLIKNHSQLGLSPAEVFTRVNQMLCEGNVAGLFVTAWMGVLDLETGSFIYANAGHNPPLIKNKDNEFKYLKTKPGFVLAGMEAMRYKQYNINLEPGDRLFLYTDGVTEATDANDKLYGEERLQNYINSHITEKVEDVLRGLRKDVDRFVGEAPQFDDITMLMFEFVEMKVNDGAIEKEFDATDDQLSSVIEFVESELERFGCPAKDSMQIAVAVEEIFVNIAHYAYVDKACTMKLGITQDDDKVTLRFSDHGLPFNPLSKQDPDITLSAEERNIGGLGIFMVKKTMDEVKYRFENGQNILVISKKISKDI